MKTMTILIVDDNPKNLQVVGEILNIENYETSFAQNGLQAIKAVKAVPPDFILLDIMMPGMDGFETCKKLKESPETKNIPIVFLTAKTETEDIIKGFELGALDYVTKPFNSHELLARVNTHLRLKYSQDLILEQQEELIKSQNELQELFHVLCHDLANPLQALSMGLEVLKIEPDKLSHDLPKLQSITKRGIELLTLVREQRAIVEGKKQLNICPINLKKAFEYSIAMLEHQFLQKKVKPVLSVSNEISVFAEKSSLVNSVLNNLFTNAIKFSFPNSSVIVDAKCEGDNVVITIKDSGIGIPPKNLEKLFIPGTQTTRLGTQNEKGTGYGMPIVKNFVTAYGGTIDVSSTEALKPSNEHGTKVKLILRQSL